MTPPSRGTRGHGHNDSPRRHEGHEDRRTRPSPGEQNFVPFVSSWFKPSFAPPCPLCVPGESIGDSAVLKLPAIYAENYRHWLPAMLAACLATLKLAPVSFLLALVLGLVFAMC